MAVAALTMPVAIATAGAQGTPSTRPTVAVMYFTNGAISNNAEYAPLSKGLAEMMITELSANTNIRVVERDRLQAETRAEYVRIREQYARGQTAKARTSLAEARGFLIDAAAAKDAAIETRPHVRAGDLDATETRRSAVEAALLHRFEPVLYADLHVTDGAQRHGQQVGVALEGPARQHDGVDGLDRMPSEYDRHAKHVVRLGEPSLPQSDKRLRAADAEQPGTRGLKAGEVHGEDGRLRVTDELVAVERDVVVDARLLRDRLVDAPGDVDGGARRQPGDEGKRAVRAGARERSTSTRGDRPAAASIFAPSARSLAFVSGL